MKKKPTPEPTMFLNVDVDVYGRARELAPLVRELGPRLIEMWVGPHRRGVVRASYESRGLSRTPESTLRALLKVLESLSPAGRRAWRAARRRDFSVGIAAGPAPHSSEFSITPETLARVAALGGELVLTIYAPRPRAARRPRPSPRPATAK